MCSDLDNDNLLRDSLFCKMLVQRDSARQFMWYLTRSNTSKLFNEVLTETGPQNYTNYIPVSRYIIEAFSYTKNEIVMFSCYL